MNQRTKVLNYLKKHGSATNFELMTKLGMTDARKRISELRASGIDIKPVMIENSKHNGNIGNYCRYYYFENK